jgi:hypothetical protein
VAVLVVVSVSKTYAASETLLDSGVDDLLRSEARRWDRMVVFPDPDSPLIKTVSLIIFHRDAIEGVCTYKKTIAWFSDRCPSRRKALSARSSAPAMALPSLPPSRPLVEEVYVFRDIRA